MKEQYADTAHFRFISAACASDTFHVVELKGNDELSQPYCFELLLTSTRSDIPIESVTGSNATLLIYRNGMYHPWSGMVSRFSFIEKAVDFSTYTLQLLPQLHILTLTVRSRIFQKQSVVKIIQTVLDEAGLSNYYTVDCNAYPEREFVMQYDESDFNFINRLMEEEGIWYFFMEDPVEKADAVSSEHCIITDKPARFAMIPSPEEIKFRSESGEVAGDESESEEYISAISMENHLIPANLSLRNYNYRTPENDLSVRKTLSGGKTGTVHQFGGNNRDVSRLQQSAEVERQRICSGRLQINGTGDCRALRAGSTVAVIDAPRDECNATLMIKKVEHTGKQTDMFDSDELQITYTNRFTAMTSDAMRDYRPPLKTRRPKINGLFTAAIEAEGAQYAHLDEQGRYRVRIPFDTATAKNGQATKPIRLSQPYSGSDYGIHFPSHENAEMIVGCINGDPDKPIGLGTVPNANTLSPVRIGNKHTGMIRTAGGNEILLDDMDGKQKVSIKSNADNRLLFDDEQQTVTLRSTADNKLFIDDKNKTVILNSEQNRMQLSYGDDGNKITIQTAGGHSITFDDENSIIEVHSTGGHKVIMDDENEVMTLTDDDNTNTVTLDRNSGIAMETEYNINLRAEGDINLEGANVAVQSNGNVEVNADGDATVEAANVEIDADSNVTINGSAQLEATGGNASFGASGMGELKAGGVLTVEGSVVNIN